MNWNAIPIEAFSGTTALVLFAVYLRFRGRVSILQMILMILFALVVGAVAVQVLSTRVVPSGSV